MPCLKEYQKILCQIESCMMQINFLLKEVKNHCTLDSTAKPAYFISVQIFANPLTLDDSYSQIQPPTKFYFYSIIFLLLTDQSEAVFHLFLDPDWMIVLVGGRKSSGIVGRQLMFHLLHSRGNWKIRCCASHLTIRARHEKR